MSELSVQNKVQDQDEDKCFVCFQPNNKESIPIPCLNNHPDKIHKKCYEEYSNRFPNCFCGNKMHIPKREHETMKIHGVFKFKTLMNNEEVIKEFTVTIDSIMEFFQYILIVFILWSMVLYSVYTV